MLVSKKSRRAAIDLSIGTIVIIVIGVTMLILGMVLVRSIMCQAIGLTGTVNDKAQAELDRYFGEDSAEVACIGAVGTEPVKMQPGTEANVIYCVIKAPQQANYQIKIVKAQSLIPTLTDDALAKWVKVDSWSGNVGTNDRTAKPAGRILIPDTAPEGSISFQLEITRDGQLISSPTLDFKISRTGFVQNLIC